MCALPAQPSEWEFPDLSHKPPPPGAEHSLAPCSSGSTVSRIKQDPAEQGGSVEPTPTEQWSQCLLSGPSEPCREGSCPQTLNSQSPIKLWTSISNRVVLVCLFFAAFQSIPIFPSQVLGLTGAAGSYRCDCWSLGLLLIRSIIHQLQMRQGTICYKQRTLVKIGQYH